MNESAAVWLRICALLVAGLACAAFAGWMLGIPALANLGSGGIPMAPSTAAAFVLCSAGVFLRLRAPSRGAAFWAELAIASIVTLAGLALLILSWRRVYLDAEHLGFAISNAPGETPIGHMSPLTAFCFLLFCLSYLTSLLSAPNRPWRALAAWCAACLLLATSLVLVLAYLYGMPVLYGSGLVPPAAPTSLAFLALAFALLGLAGPYPWSSRHRAEPARRGMHILALVFVILAAGIVIAGALYFRRSGRDYRAEVERQLSAIADLKVGDLVQWRKERFADAAIFYRNTSFSERVRRFLDNPDDADARGRVRVWLAQLQGAHQYERVLLLDVQGAPRISVPEFAPPAPPRLIEQDPEALRSREVSFVDFHREAPDLPIHLSVMVPIFGELEDSPPVAVLALCIDPHLYLYPSITRWPTLSQTAETLLVRREGDEVVYLNELRFKTDAALDLRFSLGQTELPAAQAALGKDCIIDGRDYRGVPVLACLRAVPDSPWFLVARMELSEVYAPLKQRLWVLAGFVCLLLAAAAAILGQLWRRQNALYYKERYEAAEALREQEELYHRTLDDMMEGCQILGRDWRFLYVNEAGARYARRAKDELIGRTLMECYPGVEETALFAALQRCMEERSSHRMENEFTYSDGSRAWFELNIQPSPDGLFILAMDITQRKQAEEKLWRLTEVLRALRNVNQLITHEKDRDTLLRRACEILTETRGFRSVWIGMLDASGAMRAVAEAGIGAGFAAVRAQLEQGEWPHCCRKALEQPGVVIMHNTEMNCHGCPVAHTYRDTAALAQRLEHAGRDYGVLVVALPAEMADDAEEQSLFEELAGDIGYALHAIEADQASQRAQEALRASEDRFQELFNHMGEGVAIYQAVEEGRDFVFVDLNRTGEILSQTGRENAVGRPVTQVFPGVEPMGLLDVFRRVWRTGQPEFLPLTKYEDGRIEEWVENYVYRLPSGLIVAIYSDTSEKHKAEEELHKLSMAVWQSPASVVITDTRGKIEYVNAKFLEVAGYAREEVLGQNMRMLKSGETPQEEYRRLWETIGAGGEWRGEFHNKKKDGTLFWEQAHISPIRDAAGNITHFLGIKEDITRQKSIEEQYRQAQKMEAVGQLAGGVAHDFNNILQAIVGYGAMLLERLPEGDEAHEFAREIAQGAERAAALTRQLLAFSRRQILKMEDLDLNDVVHGLTKMIRRIIGENIEVKLLEGRHSGAVHADRGQMEQVLLNLCVNARDAMPEGGTLSIETENVVMDSEYCETHAWASPGRYALLSVTDTGCGMDAETQARIFEPFFTTKESSKGTGLGLATVYGIVRQHQGMIQVYSEVGEGTAFKVYLPSIERAASEVGNKLAGRVRGGAETIIVAEDDEKVRKLAWRILKEAGYTVLLAADGEEALEVFQKHEGEVDLFLLDVMMPKMGGKAVYDVLRQQQPRLRFLFSSGYSTNAIHTGFVLKDGIELIQKPYAPDTLLRKVRDMLDNVGPIAESDLLDGPMLSD